MEKMNKKDLKIVFFGTPEFAVESLDALLTGGFNVVGVVTMPDKAAGRGHKLYQSDVKRYALEHDLFLLQPEKLKSEEFLTALRSLEADLFIVIAFRMLPREVWQMPRLGTFNLHASLLPKYRQRKIDILPEDNVGDVHDRLMHLGAEMVVETVNAIVDGTLTTTPQPEGEFTPAPKIFKEDCRIDWDRSAAEIHNHVRGLSPYPAAWTVIVEAGGRPLESKIFETLLTEDPAGDTPAGTLKKEGKRLFAACSDRWIEIVSLQPAGKKRMTADAFLLGYHPSHAQK